MCSANQIVYNMESKQNNFWNVLEIFASLKLGTVKKEKKICVKRIRGNKSLSSKLMRNIYNMYAYLQYGINKSLYSNENHMDRTPIYEYVMFHMFICKLVICSLFFFLVMPCDLQDLSSPTRDWTHHGRESPEF